VAKTKAANSKEVQGRFVVNKDNTITDRKTNLLIIQDPTLLGDAFKETMTFAQAQKAVADLNVKGYAGFKDWRLPTVEELCGMVDRTKSNPCYDTKIFKGKFDDWYWSSETCAWSNNSAWCVYALDGGVHGSGKDGRSCGRPVRSSQRLKCFLIQEYPPGLS
jgi:hypothetical protein